MDNSDDVQITETRRLQVNEQESYEAAMKASVVESLECQNMTQEMIDDAVKYQNETSRKIAV